MTYDRGTLKGWSTPVENKDRFYSPEEKLADATQKAKDVGVAYHTSVIVSHRGLELVDPYAGIYREDFSFKCLQAFQNKVSERLKSKVR